MTTYTSIGSPTARLVEADIRDAVKAVLEQLGEPRKVLALPPDFTRYHSGAGAITRICFEHLGDALTDVMPTLGTHKAMAPWQIADMYAGIPPERFRVHDWRNDVETLGMVDSAYVSAQTAGTYSHPWPAQLNRLVHGGGHDLVLSIGQVVPHEVVGMANHTKNLFIGAGGADSINGSHFIGAVHGMERMMGRADTPVRRILDRAFEQFCADLPILFILTVIGTEDDGSTVMRGLFIGDDAECFRQASALSRQVNVTMLESEPTRMVVYLDPTEFHSTWVGNKAIYRTRLAIADGGELIVLAPGIDRFGEDPGIDALIRKYGYRTTDEILARTREHADLGDNLSAAAHLIHGSTENRFQVTYCPGDLTKEEIEGVGYGFESLEAMLERYPVDRLHNGWHTDTDGRAYYYISNPALGLWAVPHRYEAGAAV